jgi:hypothetical protein
LEEMEEPPSTLMERGFNRRARRRASIVCDAPFVAKLVCIRSNLCPMGASLSPCGKPFDALPFSYEPAAEWKEKAQTVPCRQGCPLGNILTVATVDSGNSAWYDCPVA